MDDSPGQDRCMFFALIGALVVAAGTAYWVVSLRPAAARRPAAASSNPPPPHAKEGGRFRAVQIRPRLEACRAAQAIEGQRFLAKDAPPLPLPQCSAKKTCSCTFSKLPDRRTGGRRISTGGLHSTLFIAANRRVTRDRRRAAVRPGKH
jgi:hypothetical protein